MFELKDIINTAIGAVIGGLISWLVTHYYFVRNKPLEEITHNLMRLSKSIHSGLRASLVYREYPDFFTSPDAKELQVPAVNTSKPDIPQLDRVIFDRAVVLPGEQVKMLFKVLDLGLNFSNPEGAEVYDHHGRKLYLENAGFGFLLTKFNIPQDDRAGKYYLKFYLSDEQPDKIPPNKKTYSIMFSINEAN